MQSPKMRNNTPKFSSKIESVKQITAPYGKAPFLRFYLCYACLYLSFMLNPNIKIANTPRQLTTIQPMYEDSHSTLCLEHIGNSLLHRLSVSLTL